MNRFMIPYNALYPPPEYFFKEKGCYTQEIILYRGV